MPLQDVNRRNGFGVAPSLRDSVPLWQNQLRVGMIVQIKRH